MKLIKGGNGSIPNWFRFDFLSHFLLSSFSIDFGSKIDRNQSTLIEVINSKSAEKSKSIEIDRNQIVPSLAMTVPVLALTKKVSLNDCFWVSFLR